MAKYFEGSWQGRGALCAQGLYVLGWTIRGPSPANRKLPASGAGADVLPLRLGQRLRGQCEGGSFCKIRRLGTSERVLRETQHPCTLIGYQRHIWLRTPQVISHAHVARVKLLEGIARGVEVASDSGMAHVACRRGVVLSSGALQTPTILQRSGIGSREDVERLGIEKQAEADLSAVGGNLQDHQYLPFRLRTPLPCTDSGLLLRIVRFNV